MTIEVVFDISVLGTGHFLDRARTGIARVIENLAIELSLREEINLNFSAYQSLDVYLKTREYLQSQSNLDAGQLSFSDKGGVLNVIDALARCGLVNVDFPTSRNVQSRVRRKLLSLVSRGSRALTRNVDLACYEGKQILHTPFLPFPTGSESKSDLNRFITIYDLIPILFPEYFSFSETQNLIETIKGIKSSDFVFAISESTKRDFCEYAKFDPSRVFVISLAASAKFVRCSDNEVIKMVRTKYSIGEFPYVLSLCTFEPRKNIRSTIRAFRSLVHIMKSVDLKLVLVGARGWMFDSILAEIDQSGVLKERIVLTGYVPDEDLSPLYSGAMMFVYPSLYEGFGLPPLEAMQCGVPVITSNTSSLPGVVGDAGIMIDPTDEDALSQAMLDLYKNPLRCQELALRGIERARRFSWAKCADETIHAYQSAL